MENLIVTILLVILSAILMYWDDIMEEIKNKMTRNKTNNEMEKININTATAEELTKIRHIGKKRAQKIIKKRPYKDIFELSNVLGLGHKRMTDIIEEGKAVV